MEPVTAYAALFAAAFLAATLIPAQSEAVLFALLASGSYSVWGILLVASIANVLGSCVNWLLGRGMARFEGCRWFPVDPKSFAKVQGWYHRYGRWSLLLSWVPIIGDPLTVAAGALRERFAVFLTLVTLAKTGWYAVIDLVQQGWFA